MIRQAASTASSRWGRACSAGWAALLASVLSAPLALAAKPAATGCLAGGCHAETLKHSEIHRPLKAGGCAVCHFASSREHPKRPWIKEEAHRGLLKFSGDSGNATCLTCHDSIRESQEDRKNPHRKVSEKGCTLCHDPHGSERARLLKPDVFSARCFSCHKDKKKENKEFPVRHSPVTEGKACTNCHKVHSAPNSKLLAKPEVETCLGCHSKPVQRADGRTVGRVTNSAAPQGSVHKPLQEGCTSCHQAHAASHPSLLDFPVERGFYSRFEAHKGGLCFECHLPELGTLPQTDLTAFRNGSANLHALHLQRGAKGYSCLTCHEQHAAKQPRLIRSEFEFEEVSVPLKFTVSKTGGTCTTACHGEKSYDRERAVKNAPGR